MNRAKIKGLKKGDIVTVKEEQKAYYREITIRPGDQIEVNDSDVPYVFHVCSNDSGFLAGYVLQDGKQIACCGIPWGNVQAI